jgi:D-amino-acid dehydrogenase
MAARPPQTIAVIGAGVVGLSVAIYLQRAGHNVTIFDPREPGDGASFGNAGIIAVSEVLPLGRPAILRQIPRMLLDQSGPLVIRWRYLPQIAPWFLRLAAASRPSEVTHISEALASLLSLAGDAWRDIATEAGADERLVRNGWLRLYTKQRDLERALPDTARQQAVGVRINVLTAGDIRQLEPALAGSFAGGTFSADVSHINMPVRMMQALAATIRRRGGVYSKREIRQIAADPNPILIDTMGYNAAFDRVVIAAGAWSRRLVRTLGMDVPLDTERGYHVMLPPPPAALRRPVSIVSPGYTLVPMDEGIRLTSGVEFAGLDVPADFRRIRRMAAHAASILPGLEPRPLSEWLGFRPSLPRSLPMIGPVRKKPTVILAFGHGHLGVTLGPITGQLVAALINGNEPPLDPSPFRPPT